MNSNSQRLNEIKSWVSYKRSKPNAGTAQTDLAIALAYLDELTGNTIGSENTHRESQEDYFGRTGNDYTASSLANQISDVESGKVVPR